MDIKYKLRALLANLGVDLIRMSGVFGPNYFGQWRNEFFDRSQAHGLHITPNHYYTPIPNRADIARPIKPTPLVGLKLDTESAAIRASTLLKQYELQLQFLSGSPDYDPSNQALHPLDAALLYSIIRRASPRRIIEIGSGFSTKVIARALRDGNIPAQFFCIEPFLPTFLKPLPAEVTEVIEHPVQEVPLSRFQDLEAGDILFIDSTHVVRYGSDVIYEILEILPSLRSGVLVHVHDIFLPDDYPQIWLKKYRFFWNEQYLLQAFLSMNPSFQVDFPVHAIKSKLTGYGRAIADAPGAETIANSFWFNRRAD